MAKKKMTLEEKLEEAIVKDVPYEVHENWINARLNSIVKFEKGKKPKILIDNFEDEAIPYVTIKYFQTKVADQYTFATETNRICNEDDILIVWDGARAGLIGTGVQGALGSTLCNIKFDNINKKFMYYYFLGKYDLINSNTKGTGIPHVDPTYLDTLVLSIPPLKEQQRIVEKIESLFDKLDKAKELIEEARDDFEKRKSAILEKAFKGQLTKEWRKNNRVLSYGISYLNEISQMRSDIYKKLLDDSKNNKTKRPTKIHDVNFECIEHENCNTWIKTKLGNVLYDFRYGTSSKSDYSFDGIPVIRIPNLSNGYITHEDMKYLKENDVDMNNKVKIGDLVIVRSNGSASLVGKTSLITESEDEFAFASYLIRMRPCKVDSKYLYYVLNSISVKEQFYSKSKSTSGINNINTGELGNSIIPLPPLEEQEEIVRILDKLLDEESKINELTKLEEQIELIKKSILAKAFRGQLETNCEDDESAIELLKEILKNE
ncbi:MAG: restriction endonuclease subunit S [Clostridium sp.]